MEYQKILYSDNGPEFSSLEFRQFAKAYEFHHVTSSPQFPQSNGLAERTVQTAKKLLKKAYEDKIPIWQFWSCEILQFLAWVFHQHSY